MPSRERLCRGFRRSQAGGALSCAVCGSAAFESLLTVEAIPTSSCILLRDQQQALDHPVGSMELAICTECGFMTNQRFDPRAIDYRMPYEESQANSPTFLAFAEETITGLIARHGLRQGSILEVGCGKAEWLALACRLGAMHGIGIDPAYVPGRTEESDVGQFEVIPEFFGPEWTHLTANLIACRHTLEHVPDPAQFTTWLAQSARRTEGAVVFIEVPDTMRILEEGAFWDVYYEHCSYFTSASLERVLVNAGFDPLVITRGFGDQYLLAEAVVRDDRRLESPAAGSADVAQLAHDFTRATTGQIEAWRRRLDATEGPVVLWAATSKTVGFLSAIGRKVAAAIDINPAKHGSYLPGSGTAVLAPDSLTNIRPELVVIMNPIYRAEIERDLQRMGIEAEVVSLGDRLI